MEQWSLRWCLIYHLRTFTNIYEHLRTFTNIHGQGIAGVFDEGSSKKDIELVRHVNEKIHHLFYLARIGSS